MDDAWLPFGVDGRNGRWTVVICAVTLFTIPHAYLLKATCFATYYTTPPQPRACYHTLHACLHPRTRASPALLTHLPPPPDLLPVTARFTRARRGRTTRSFHCCVRAEGRRASIDEHLPVRLAPPLPAWFSATRGWTCEHAADRFCATAHVTPRPLRIAPARGI